MNRKGVSWSIQLKQIRLISCPNASYQCIYDSGGSTSLRTSYYVNCYVPEASYMDFKKSIIGYYSGPPIFEKRVSTPTIGYRCPCCIPTPDQRDHSPLLRMRSRNYHDPSPSQSDLESVLSSSSTSSPSCPESS